MRIFTAFTSLMLFFIIASGQPSYESYFKQSALRIDFTLAGNADTTFVYEKAYKEEPQWGGQRHNLISPLNYGQFRISVYDSATQKLIYRRGKSTLYKEWQTTQEAHKRNRSFYQSMRIPYPKNTIRYSIEERRYKTGKFRVLYKAYINPESYRISHEKPPAYTVDTIGKHQAPNAAADIVFLPEGYPREAMAKFIADVRRIRKNIFSYQPFGDYKDKFNFYAVRAPSKDPGTDIPGDTLYKHTLFNSSFYTFNIPRYLTSRDVKTIRNAAGLVPYDHIFVLVNSSRYGGGGIYNDMSLTTADGPLSKQVSVHEFGHGFAGLADEYYNSDVATSEFYYKAVEPWEPNITTLTNFKTKWEKQIHDTIPVPTPRLPKYKGKIGVYEGGGYVAKGIYSPFQDCRMKTNEAEAFCPVCKKAIVRMIQFYTEQIAQ